MKKGISLIVLVITIIVMIIIAGAIILALNSSNVTNKANWAQVSADRANLQSEFATILADVVAKQKIGPDDYLGVTVADVTADPAYTTWASKVKTTNPRFDIVGLDDNTKPAAIKVVMDDLTKDEAEAFGLTFVTENKGTSEAPDVRYTGAVKGYDWVTVPSMENVEVEPAE